MLHSVGSSSPYRARSDRFYSPGRTVSGPPTNAVWGRPGRATPRPAAAVTLSVVVPVFNEEAVLVKFQRRLAAVLADLGVAYEIIYIDDGSTDQTIHLLKRLQRSHPGTSYARLTRNFGKEAAMSAGLKLATGEAVVVIDADLQDPPELLPAMVAAWRGGADVVNMRRRVRLGESWWKRTTASAFYHLIERVSDVPIARDVGDFRLFSRRAVDALNQLPERGRFMKGLFAWVGFPQATIDYERSARAAGETKWPFLKLIGLAFDGITAFSAAPLKVATLLGLASAGSAFAYAIFFFLKALILGDAVQGFPTLIVSMLFLGGLQLLCMGMLGEYVARIFTETKGRPIYLIDVYEPATVPSKSKSNAAR
ncbi:glycosyltransferase family 2 protein [Variovorax sp. R-27]|uniref:glycosyltransferase family 2 protein n=1 Tax=Variovorax sp. R-27 TaxID=3404058 RepID=UPI003CE6A97D